MAGLGGTPWVDRNLSLAWHRVLAASPFGGEGMPRVEGMRRSRVVVEEYGCGHYGCVMPTAVPDVVFKLSSDPTEAYFIAAAMQLGFDYEADGIVRYYGIYRIAGAFHRRRPLYAIWREEAYDLGFPIQWSRGPGHDWPGGSAYERRRDADLAYYLALFKLAAAKVRSALERRQDPYEVVADALDAQPFAYERIADLDLYRPLRTNESMLERIFSRETPTMRVAIGLETCRILAEVMENTDGADAIGRALGYYLGEGLLLADVHAQNVGKVMRDGWEQRVITDPGHAVPLSPRWATVEIEEV